MTNIIKLSQNPEGISDEELFASLELSLGSDISKLKKVLILPPDFTRFHSCAGKITKYYYLSSKRNTKNNPPPRKKTNN